MRVVIVVARETEARQSAAGYIEGTAAMLMRPLERAINPLCKKHMEDPCPDTLATLEGAIAQLDTSLGGQRDQIAVLGSALSASRLLLASMEATLTDLHARRTALLARTSGPGNG